MRHHRCLGILGTTYLVVACLPALAAWPAPYMNYQGVLRDSADNPLNGTYDMVFRFYDNLDNEILIDRHTSAQGGAVGVTLGMFNVFLGGGLVEDGSGPGNYTALWDVFRDHQYVALEIQIGADSDPDREILVPRTQILSAAYAMNASSLNGVQVTSLLLSDASDAFTGGTLTFNEGTVLDVNGTFRMDGTVTKATTTRVDNFNADLLDGNDSTSFSRLGLNNTFTGANSFTRIPVNSSMYGGGIAIDAPAATPDFTLFGAGVAGQEKFRVDAEGDVFSKGWINVDGAGPLLRLRDATGANTLTQIFANDNSNFTYLYDWQNSRYVLYSNPDGIGIGTGSPDPDFDVTIPGLRVTSTNVGFDGRLYMNYDGPEASQSIYFYNNGSRSAESLTWDDTQNRFEFSDALALARIDSGSTSLTPVSYNRFGTGTAEDSGVSDANDAYFTDRVEVDGTLLLNSTLYLSDGSSSPLWQWIYFWGGTSFSESISFSTWTGRQFNVSDNLQVDGNLTVSGAKSFVQNHPEDSELSVLYVALEGDEAGTYTRGSGRLLNGEARIALGETFAWVTNPEMGLTAHVTPRSPDSVVYVESVSAEQLVVRSIAGFADDAAFDYIVHGIRIGYEEFQTVRPRVTQAPVPSEAYYQRLREGHPELQRYTAAARFRSMRPQDAVAAHDGSSVARVLRESIGVYDPDVDDPNRDSRFDASTRSESGSKDLATPSQKDDSSTGSSAAFTGSAEGILPEAEAPPAVVRDPSFAVSEPVDTGDLLTLDGEQPGALERSSTALDPRIVGIAAHPSLEADGVLRVALIDTLYAVVKADAGYGEIRPGDLLTSSFTPGHVMRATEMVPGTIIGKALEPLEAGAGLIKILVMPR